MQKKIQLKNGLKVLLIESKKSPVVSIQMWVKTGSADEVKKEEGLSHFIEHLVFKGTDKFKVGEIAGLVEGSGGELNAYTSFDQTVFYVTISNKFTNVGLDVISQMMGFPTFDPIEIDNEREVVIEEIKRGEDSPNRQIAQMMFSNVYKKHPYRVPVIGYAKNIKSVSAKKIKSYFQGRYVPRNMFLVVSGDFETVKMKTDVEKYFGGFKDFRVKNVKRPKDLIQKETRVKIEKSKFQEAMLYVSFQGPSVRHKDVPGLDVLSLILGQGDSSRLVHRLRIEEPVVTGTGAFTFTPQDHGVVAFSGTMPVQNLKKYFDILSEEIEKSWKSSPEWLEIQKAVNALSSEEVYSVETVDGIARKAGSMEFYMNDPNYHKKFLKAINQIKPIDLVKLAEKYFHPDRMTITLMTPGEVSSAKKVVGEFVKDLKKKHKALAKTKKVLKPAKGSIKKLKFHSDLSGKTPKTELIDLGHGAKLLYRYQPETPSCTIKFGFLGGTRLEDGLSGGFKNAPLGLSEMYSRVWPSGAKGMSELEINQKVDLMAAGLSCFAGRNTVGMGIEFLSQFQDDMLTIATEVLQNPEWNSKVIEREKEILGNQIKTQQDNPAQICSKEFMKMIFEGHPYAREVLGTQESIAKISGSDLKDYHHKIYKTGNLKICAVGDIEKSTFVEKMEKLVQGLGKGAALDQKIKMEPITSDKYYFVPLKKEQSHLIYGFRGLSLTDSDRFTLEVIQAILAGQGGRLFIELRDKNSLAYSVSPMKMAGIEGGYFGAYIGCSPDKTKKAVDMMKIEFDKLMQNAVSKEELTRAQRYLAGRNDIDLQSKSTVCSSILFNVMYGLGHDEIFKTTEKYFQVTPDQIQKLSQKIFSQHKVISLVGPKEME